MALSSHQQHMHTMVRYTVGTTDCGHLAQHKRSANTIDDAVDGDDGGVCAGDNADGDDDGGNGTGG